MSKSIPKCFYLRLDYLHLLPKTGPLIKMTEHYSDKTDSQSNGQLQKNQTKITPTAPVIERQKSPLYINEEQLLLAMRATNDGLWDWNLETDEVYYSPSWKSMLGYKEDELDSNLNTWATLVHPEDKDRVLAKAHDYIANRTDSFHVEMRMIHKDGYPVFVLSRAFPCGPRT